MTHTVFSDPKETCKDGPAVLLTALSILVDGYTSDPDARPGLMIPMKILPNGGLRVQVWTAAGPRRNG